MDGHGIPPPLPDRPGRAVRVHSISSLHADTEPNDYIDSTALKPRRDEPLKPPSKTEKASLTLMQLRQQTSEHSDNITNETKERFQAKKKSHTLPLDLRSLTPSAGDLRAPPLPPRTHLVHSSRLNTHPSDGGEHQRLSPAPSLPVSHSSVRGDAGKHCQWKMPPVPLAQGRSRSLQPAVVIMCESHSGLSALIPSVRHTRRFDTQLQQLQQRSAGTPITRQPNSHDLTMTLNQSGTVTNSIICSQCGQCRCSSCTGDRKLPEHWLCEGNCRCSADSVIDTVTCMCCVKSLFKKCFDNPDGRRAHPCACTSTADCCMRWAALSTLSLCLPCLCCYWPLQGCAAAATACYNCRFCRRSGCNCDPKS